MRKDGLSESVKNDIILAWDGLITSRLSDGRYDNQNDPYNRESRIATAEGIEAFLIPCLVSPELKLELLDRMETRRINGKKFMDAFTDDINYLVNKTIIKEDSKGNISEKDAIEKGFYSDPYWNPEDIKKALRPEFKARYPALEKGYIETVDSIAYIVPAMIHCWTLFKDYEVFHKKPNKIDFRSIEKVIKSGVEKLVKWHIDGEGWGWGDNAYGLPTNLYSTWTVCEALTEIDEYILRVEIISGEKNPFGFNAADIWKCLEETRDYVIKTYLDAMIEAEPISIDKHGIKRKPSVNDELIETYVNLNNDLYALDTLITTYADRKWENHVPFIVTVDNRIEEAGLDEEISNKLELALYKIIKIYKNPEAKKILQEEEYSFYFDIGNILSEKAFRQEPKWFTYSDKSFLPLLLRVILQMLIYEIGNPIVLEELTKEIYIDLLLTRHKKDLKLRHCWDDTYFGVYSTERAVEALSELYNYYQQEETSMNVSEEVFPERFNEVISFVDSFSFSSQLIQKMKEEGIPAARLNDKETVSKVLAFLREPRKDSDIGVVDANKIDMVDINIEFAHVKKYLNGGDIDDLRKEIGTEIDRVNNEVINLNESDYSICVLLDDYNNQTAVTEEIIARDLEKIGLKPDYVMRESQLAHIAETLIDLISEKREILEEDEVVTFFERSKDKRIILKRRTGKVTKYECGLLAACWYLMRLGIDPFADNIKYIKRFSDKPFFGKRIRTFLKREKYLEAEEITMRIIQKVKGESLNKIIETIIIS